MVGLVLRITDADDVECGSVYIERGPIAFPATDPFLGDPSQTQLTEIFMMTEDFDKQVVKHPLSPEFYRLTEEEIAFHKAQTGIQDDDELKKHILAVQRDAYEVRLRVFSERYHVAAVDNSEQVFPYPCIRWFTFARSVTNSFPLHCDQTEVLQTADISLSGLHPAIGVGTHTPWGHLPRNWLLL